MMNHNDIPGSSSESFSSPSPLWLGKPYYSLDAYCKNTFREKLYKISLDAGFTCPNRDGTVSHGGCIFCSEGGSGDFASRLSCPEQIREALLEGRGQLSQKQTGNLFIAYFQAYTGTYGPIEYLESVYRAALSVDFVAGISIATRPDCLPTEVIKLLQTLKQDFPDKFIWIELGLQTIHERTAQFIRRGYPLSVFEQALDALSAIDIPVIVHLILGLPGETTEDILSSVTYLNKQKIAGVKLQLLHILKNTDLASYCQKHPQEPVSYETLDTYLDVLISCIEHLRPDIVIHRVTGDAPKELLIAPLWSANKRNVLNTLHQKMKQRSAYQGKEWKGNFHAGSVNTL